MSAGLGVDTRQGDHPEHRTWQGIKTRCLNPKDKSYPRYGGRGITICEEWRASFWAFLEDVGPRPSPHHQIERIDNDRGYEPGNCRWATRSEQMRNKRNSALLTLNGITATQAEWSERTGIDRRLIHYRIKNGWSVAEALSVPTTEKRMPTCGACGAQQIQPFCAACVAELRVRANAAEERARAATQRLEAAQKYRTSSIRHAWFIATTPPGPAGPCVCNECEDGRAYLTRDALTPPAAAEPRSREYPGIVPPRWQTKPRGEEDK